MSKHTSPIGKTPAIITILVFAAVLSAAALTACSPVDGENADADPDGNKTSLYFKDVDCIITDIQSRWVVTQWVVDISFESPEYGLSGHQRLTMGDAMRFHDAEIGEHVAVEMLSTVLESDGEVLDRRLSHIVVSAGHDPDHVKLR